MTTTKKLRLGPLPKLQSTELTFACPVSLKADLYQYAELHARTYGEAVDAVILIPHMLQAFMAGDRGIQKESAHQAVILTHYGESFYRMRAIVIFDGKPAWTKPRSQKSNCSVLGKGLGQN